MAKSSNREKKTEVKGSSSTETVAPKEFVAEGAPVAEAPTAAEPAAEPRQEGKGAKPESERVRMVAWWRKNSKVYKAVKALYERRGGREA